LKRAVLFDRLDLKMRHVITLLLNLLFLESSL
jgi:hypothetical protein